MSAPRPLPPERLYTPCSLEHFDFRTTADLEALSEVLGQERAMKAVQFGAGIRREGYNLYVMGPPGMGKHSTVRQFLERQSADEPIPADWCYVNNFEQPHKPRALRLPPGEGKELKADMEHLIEELSTTLPSTFEGEEYRNRIQSIEDELKEQQEHAFEELAEEAEEKRVKLFRTPSGFAFAPMREGEVLGPKEFEKLPKDEQAEIEHLVQGLQEKLQNVVKQIPQWRREVREKIKSLNREVTMSVVGHLIEELQLKYDEHKSVGAFLAAVEHDVVENVADFLKQEEHGEGEGVVDPKALHRYKVNVIVDNGRTEGAPVLYQDNPTYLNLVGRAEHLAQYGTLVTDFTLLKPGSLHEAAGGYLLLDAHKLLTHPYAWEGLKRALYANEVRIESLERMLSLVSTVSLEPEPIPLNIKVVVLGDRMLYYLLHEYDPDFAELFKINADFEDRIERNEDNAMLYARLIATLSKKEGMKPFDRKAVARIIEHGSRVLEDAERLSTHMRSIGDILREADHWAHMAGHDVITMEDVQKTIDEQVHRASRVREGIQEEIQRETILIDTEGSVVGQINALSVLSMGDFAFGQPSRITANVHLGDGHVVDIEREVELGGALHSKGVMILSSFLAARYAQQQPLSVAASLVFEQSYGGVDGDSASLAELCCLLSALSGAGIKQALAVTGSVNQHGRVQPIGGVNEKIEGFFDVCRSRGLTGEQGVLIPEANVKHLMLRRDVVDAVAAEQFAIYPVRSVDEAVTLLTGVEAGTADANGDYPAQSLNGRVHARLKEMSELRQAFGDHGKDDDGDKESS